jgi:hypothetical protein
MMELPRQYSTPSEGGRFAPIKSSNYGGRPLTGPTSRPAGPGLLARPLVQAGFPAPEGGSRRAHRGSIPISAACPPSAVDYVFIMDASERALPVTVAP